MIEVLDHRHQVIRTSLIKMANGDNPSTVISSAAEQGAATQQSALKDIIAATLLSGAAGIGARALTGSSYLFGRPSESSSRSLVPTQMGVPIPYYATDKEKEHAEAREAKLLSKVASVFDLGTAPLAVPYALQERLPSPSPRELIPDMPSERELIPAPRRSLGEYLADGVGSLREAPKLIGNQLTNLLNPVPAASAVTGLGGAIKPPPGPSRLGGLSAAGAATGIGGAIKPTQPSWWDRYKKPLGIAAGVGLLGGGLLGYASRRRKKKRDEEDGIKESSDDDQPNLLERAFKGTNARTEQHIPWYLPGIIGGGLLGGVGGYALSDSIIDKKRKADLQTEVDAAKEEYQQALLANYQPGQIPVQKNASVASVGAQLDRIADLLGISEDTPMEKVAGLEQILGRTLGLYGSVALPAALLAGMASYGYTRSRSSDKLLEKALKQRERDRISRRPPEIMAVPESVHYQHGMTVPAEEEKTAEDSVFIRQRFPGAIPKRLNDELSSYTGYHNPERGMQGMSPESDFSHLRNMIYRDRSTTPPYDVNLDNRVLATRGHGLTFATGLSGEAGSMIIDPKVVTPAESSIETENHFGIPKLLDLSHRQRRPIRSAGQTTPLPESSSTLLERNKVPLLVGGGLLGGGLLAAHLLHKRKKKQREEEESSR